MRESDELFEDIIEEAERRHSFDPVFYHRVNMAKSIVRYHATRDITDHERHVIARAAAYALILAERDIITGGRSQPILEYAATEDPTFSMPDITKEPSNEEV